MQEQPQQVDVAQRSTSEWLLQSTEFASWLNEDESPRMSWIPGPSVGNRTGKSTLMESLFKQGYTKAATFRRKSIRLSINGSSTFARPDTGSDQNIITEAFAIEHHITIQRGESDRSLFSLGDNSKVESIGKALVPFRISGLFGKLENSWFHVLKRCAVPLILGMEFIEKFQLYQKNRHLLKDFPSTFGSLPTLKLIGKPRGFIDFQAEGINLVGCADTGSDLDFISYQCAKRLGFDIDGTARTRVMLADKSIVETVGEVHISSVEITNFDSFEMSFHVLPGLVSDVIFSEDFLEQMDAFNTCVQVKDTTSLFQQRLNTLISLGPIQTFLAQDPLLQKVRNRFSKVDRLIPFQEDYCQVRDSETCRRSNVKRSIRKMRDESRKDTAREAEEVIKKGFDRDHASCAHCKMEDPGG